MSFHKVKQFCPPKPTTVSITCFQPPNNPATKNTPQVCQPLPLFVQVSGHSSLSTRGATSNANDKGLHMVLFTFTFPQHHEEVSTDDDDFFLHVQAQTLCLPPNTGNGYSLYIFLSGRKKKRGKNSFEPRSISF